jgi:plasmid stabilization system protein ParE
MKVAWTEQAFARLAEVQSYISADDPTAAARFVGRLAQRTLLLARTPGMGRIVPELLETGLRELVFGNYRIVYRVHRGAVQVLTVFESHRLLPRQDVSPERLSE